MIGNVIEGFAVVNCLQKVQKREKMHRISRIIIQNMVI